MLRDKNLVPLSRQHQHALALCVRIDRAPCISESDLIAWQQEIRQHFEQEIRFHFAAEERVVFPAADRFPELVPMVHELLAEHKLLRNEFVAAEGNTMSAPELKAFARQLATHIRKEERILFERLQALLTPEEMQALGAAVNDALAGAAAVCALPRRKSGL